MARRGNQTREGDDGGWNKEKDNIGLNDIGQGNVGVEVIGLKDIGLEDIVLSDIGLNDIGHDNVGLEDIGNDDLGQDHFWTALNQTGQDLACANRAGFVLFCFPRTENRKTGMLVGGWGLRFCCFLQRTFHLTEITSRWFPQIVFLSKTM